MRPLLLRGPYLGSIDVSIADLELAKHDCLESVDRVPRDVTTTAFRRKARLRQALWRESLGLPEGTEPIKARKGVASRPLGSRLDYRFARESGVNFLTEAARDAARHRVEHPERLQTLKVDRLYADLLSSMPMCFNLFGPLWADRQLAQRAAEALWPDARGEVSELRFEWSPGRAIPGRYLENRSAFDTSIHLQLAGGGAGVIGVETKYHEYCQKEKLPSDIRIRRYRVVAEKSGVFVDGATDVILGTHLHQIWLDHLLALSMLQDESARWRWAKFVLVHPAENPSFARAANAYMKLLRNPSTFEVRTIESMLDSGILPQPDEHLFRRRYLG
jgi:PD-(D/E)XK nuclease superfamily